MLDEVKKFNPSLKPSLDIRMEHRGTYFCVATNLVGHGSRRNIDVEVTEFTIYNLYLEFWIHSNF